MITCLITCGWGKRGHATCKALLIQQNLFLSVEFHGGHMTVTKLM